MHTGVLVQCPEPKGGKGETMGRQHCMALMTVMLLVAKFMIVFSAESTETTTTVRNAVVSPGSHSSPLNHTDAQVPSFRGERHSNATQPIVLTMEPQDCVWPHTRGMALETVAQGLGSRCGTPTGSCQLPYRLPLNSACCCPNRGCGYVAP
jgi:hypothetical protein